MRSRSRPNAVVALFLLILVLLLAGPNLVPRLASSVIPGFDEGVPCEWLPRASDRANHQSLIGRGAVNPISLRVRPGAITRDPAGLLTIGIVVTNTSVGTVPFIYDPNQVIVGDDGTSGLGLIFNPANSLTTGGTRPGNPATYPEDNIRLLAPRQSCVHRAEFPNGNILIDPAVSTGTASVRAYYRATTPGQTIQPPGAVATPIYRDQGVWVGYVESDAVTLAVASQ